MPDTCTVSADDLRIVTQTMTTAFGYLRHLPGVDDILAACARLAAAVDQAALPPSPVSGTEQLAIMDRHTYDAYRAQEFDDEQAFALLQQQIALRNSVTLIAAQHG